MLTAFLSVFCFSRHSAAAFLSALLVAPAAVIGAGGAARAVVAALLERGVPELRIANRTRIRADQIRAEFGARVARVARGLVDRGVGPEGRVGVCLEILDRLHGRVFELANAVQHTSGQPFVMAFQAGGPHAQDRALEAVTVALAEQRKVPESVIWEKPAKGEPIRMQKDYRVIGRGVGLVIGCNTFPTWNAYPGIFASLATGNPVVVKPHPQAVLPLAITVEVAREVLAELIDATTARSTPPNLCTPRMIAAQKARNCSFSDSRMRRARSIYKQ